MKQQLSEAIRAGEIALDALHDAQDKLKSAKRWGLFDLLGGDLLATLVKRSKMKDARALIDEVKYALANFQLELRDVEIMMDVNLEDDGLLAFADYVFDDLFSDFLVQRRIGKALDQLTRIERQVSSIVAALKEKYRA